MTCISYEAANYFNLELHPTKSPSGMSATKDKQQSNAGAKVGGRHPLRPDPDRERRALERAETLRKAAYEMAENQHERAYHKQSQIFQGRFLRKDNARCLRFYKSIGMGYHTPITAINGTYIDKKCPFTGNVSIRGRILRGVVHSAKMQRSIIVRRDYLHFVQKYKRYERRHKHVAAHLSPCFRVKEGDIVTIGECRPLSKTIRFNVIKVEPVSEAAKKRFSPF